MCHFAPLKLPKHLSKSKFLANDWQPEKYIPLIIFVFRVWWTAVSTPNTSCKLQVKLALVPDGQWSLASAETRSAGHA